MSLPHPLHRNYPEDVYHGEGGEASAWLRPVTTEPELRFVNGGTCEYLATGDQTGGLYGLYRWSFGEQESGPDAHFHRSITESFYVLEGSVRLYDGTDWVTARAGDFLHVPEGGVHGFRGGDHARMLLMFTPGAPREDYFETLGALGRGATMTDDERAAFMLQHDTFWV
ncbi:MAG TPA: cupin domain-containing protein [Nocardioides sp.]|nr:cupin domain-containing protein [Nocardioides sp.]